tara:strand:+ start:2915 stop:3619 length:705 start_codon:yes stop_codon:yes gene_type:complete
MKAKNLAAGIVASLTLPIISAQAEPLIYGVQVEQLEYRLLEDETEVLAWDGDFIVGTDELKFVLRSEGEFKTDGDVMETMETQARLQVPISTFFDAVAGIRVDTPEGPDQVHGVVGVKGLAPQWFEIDADLFLSDYPSFRFEAEYEALITNRLILTPSIEVDLPFRDNPKFDKGMWGPTVEVGARLSYDLIDRSVSPYIGVHYERSFGKTRDIALSENEEGDALFFVTGLRLLF